MTDTIHEEIHTMGSAEIQGALWGAAAEDWADLVEPLSTPLYEAVLDAVGVDAEARLLDAGCGAGLALQLAAKRGARVTGLDASGPLLDVARRRLPDADLRQGELEALPFDDDTFTAVTAFNSVQYAADPVAALAELRRVAVAGAPVAVVSWAAAERCETRSVLAAVGSLLPPPPPGAGGPFALSEPGALEDLVGSAGLTAMGAGEVAVRFEFADLYTAVRGHLSSGPARRAIDEAGVEAVEEALRTALEASLQPDGRSRQENAFRYVVATT
jgi:SAM-dependent methyltransferase